MSTSPVAAAMPVIRVGRDGSYLGVVDLDVINRFFGTSLRSEELKVHVYRGFFRGWIDRQHDRPRERETLKEGPWPSSNGKRRLASVKRSAV